MLFYLVSFSYFIVIIYFPFTHFLCIFTLSKSVLMFWFSSFFAFLFYFLLCSLGAGFRLSGGILFFLLVYSEFSLSALHFRVRWIIVNLFFIFYAFISYFSLIFSSYLLSFLRLVAFIVTSPLQSICLYLYPTFRSYRPVWFSLDRSPSFSDCVDRYFYFPILLNYRYFFRGYRSLSLYAAYVFWFIFKRNKVKIITRHYSARSILSNERLLFTRWRERKNTEEQDGGGRMMGRNEKEIARTVLEVERGGEGEKLKMTRKERKLKVEMKSKKKNMNKKNKNDRREQIKGKHQPPTP